MNFQTLEELIQAIDKNQNYNHQIKGKRLKKQLKSISQLQFQHIQFQKFEITDVGIYLHINVKSDEKEQTDILLRLDHEYPFNPPQIFYTNQTKSTEYGYGKDLLPTILKNQMWGPSLTLPIFIQKLPNLQSLKKGEKILWTYHNQFEYGFDQLKKLGVKLYNVQQYTWQYKVIKIKKAKILGFTPDHLLKFQKCLDNQKILKLELWLPIKYITQVQVKTGKKNYQLQINYTTSDNNKSQNKIQKIYLGGQPTNLQIILDNLNSIEMIERKVKNFQKIGVKDYDDAIKCYTTLIEFYSLTNKELTEKYMNAMKKLIESVYSQDKNKEQKMVEIQT